MTEPTEKTEATETTETMREILDRVNHSIGTLARTHRNMLNSTKEVLEAVLESDEDIPFADVLARVFAVARDVFKDEPIELVELFFTFSMLEMAKLELQTENSDNVTRLGDDVVVATLNISDADSESTPDVMQAWANLFSRIKDSNFRNGNVKQVTVDDTLFLTYTPGTGYKGDKKTESRNEATVSAIPLAVLDINSKERKVAEDVINSILDAIMNDPRITERETLPGMDGVRVFTYDNEEDKDVVSTTE